MVFVNMWKKQGLIQKGHGKLTIQLLLKCVWGTVYQKWNALNEGIKVGSITLKEFDDHFGLYDMHMIKRDLNLYCNGQDDQWIKDRILQIEQYKMLKVCLLGAKVIKNFVCTFELMGDFTPIEKIVKMVSSNRYSFIFCIQSRR